MEPTRSSPVRAHELNEDTIVQNGRAMVPLKSGEVVMLRAMPRTGISSYVNYDMRVLPVRFERPPSGHPDRCLVLHLRQHRGHVARMVRDRLPLHENNQRNFNVLMNICLFVGI